MMNGGQTPMKKPVVGMVEKGANSVEKQAPDRLTINIRMSGQ